MTTIRPLSPQLIDAFSFSSGFPSLSAHHTCTHCETCCCTHCRYMLSQIRNVPGGQVWWCPCLFLSYQAALAFSFACALTPWLRPILTSSQFDVVDNQALGLPIFERAFDWRLQRSASQIMERLQGLPFLRWTRFSAQEQLSQLGWTKLVWTWTVMLQ